MCDCPPSNFDLKFPPEIGFRNLTLEKSSWDYTSNPGTHDSLARVFLHSHCTSKNDPLFPPLVGPPLVLGSSLKIEWSASWYINYTFTMVNGIYIYRYYTYVYIYIYIYIFMVDITIVKSLDDQQTWLEGCKSELLQLSPIVLELHRHINRLTTKRNDSPTADKLGTPGMLFFY